MVVFMEWHRADTHGAVHRHYHVALKADRSCYFMPFKRALLKRHRVATHWSTSHVGYWSAVRYGCRATPAKGEHSLDPSPVRWSCSGPHEALEDACEEPTSAAALAGRRQKAVQQAGAKGMSDPRPSEIDVWPLIVRHNIRNTPENQEAHLRLIQVARECCSSTMVSFLFKNRRRLPALIDDVWLWEEINDHVTLSQQSRIDALFAALRKPCVCE
eukprot:1539665-Karenia_brevis.AAC.1